MDPRIIPTKVHAAEDYLTTATLPFAARRLGVQPATRRIMDGVAAVAGTQSMMTDYEGGLIRKLPMRAHLMADVAMGLGLIAIAAAMRKSPRLDRWALAGLGAFSVVTAALTHTRADDRH